MYKVPIKININSENADIRNLPNIVSNYFQDIMYSSNEDNFLIINNDDKLLLWNTIKKGFLYKKSSISERIKALYIWDKKYIDNENKSLQEYAKIVNKLPRKPQNGCSVDDFNKLVKKTIRITQRHHKTTCECIETGKFLQLNGKN